VKDSTRVTLKVLAGEVAYKAPLFEEEGLWERESSLWEDWRLGPRQRSKLSVWSLTGGEATFPGVTGTLILKAFDYNVARTGLTMR